jgi:nucleolar protein 12
VSKWKAENPADGDDEKVYLKPNEKRRVAFIKQDFHDEASTVNAYMVFAYSAPNRSANVPSLLDPFVAAERAIETCDGTLFMDRTIRVDRANSKGAPGSSGDMKLTIFVGNLDFTAKEEDLRSFFEKLVETEAGTKEVGSEYVKHVRIIRDGATQLGKGFAYVEFKVMSLIKLVCIRRDEFSVQERSVVDEILALEPQKLKFAKRKIRVQRCKSLPGSTLPKAPAQPIAESQLKSVTKGTKPKTPAVGQQSHQKAVPIPKGDPSLGDRLRKLSKEERKAAKSSDPSRVARRLAKKKARNTLQKEGVPVKGKERSKNAKSKPSGTKPKQNQLKVGRPKGLASRG